MNRQSEFGKGLTVCLIKFAMHFNNNQMKTIKMLDHYANKTPKEQKQMLLQSPPPTLNYGKNYHDNLRTYINSMLPIYNNDLTKLISHEITLWANGATDHLYEIQSPKGTEWSTIRKKVKQLQNKGLTMGHSFLPITYTIKDIQELQQLINEITILIDKKLGLKPDIGEWA